MRVCGDRRHWLNQRWLVGRLWEGRLLDWRGGDGRLPRALGIGGQCLRVLGLRVLGLRFLGLRFFLIDDELAAARFLDGRGSLYALIFGRHRQDKALCLIARALLLFHDQFLAVGFLGSGFLGAPLLRQTSVGQSLLFEPLLFELRQLTAPRLVECCSLRTLLFYRAFLGHALGLCLGVILDAVLFVER